MSFLAGLNDAQRRAVDHHEGPLLVVAGAGGGKTRALTHRIAHLIGEHGADPAQILAVTFTNKAAREMKERLEVLWSEAGPEPVRSALDTLPPVDQRQLRSRIYHEESARNCGSAPSTPCSRGCCATTSTSSRTRKAHLDKQFSIYDEADAPEPGQGDRDSGTAARPQAVRAEEDPLGHRQRQEPGLAAGGPAGGERRGQRGKLTADVYRRYRKALAANNLDFDDLLLPVQLLQQNEQVRSYWHRRFRHVLVDEYQGHQPHPVRPDQAAGHRRQGPADYDDWAGRSVFVVGDADQSIYSFRAADFTILMGFQDDFGDQAPDDATRTMVKLEENYRSTATILEAASALIANNGERIDKVLRPTRGEELISLTRCDDEVAEAEAMVHRLRTMEAADWWLRAIGRAVPHQCRVPAAIEESLVRWGIPFIVVGGFVFMTGGRSRICWLICGC